MVNYFEPSFGIVEGVAFLFRPLIARLHPSKNSLCIHTRKYENTIAVKARKPEPQTKKLYD